MTLASLTEAERTIIEQEVAKPALQPYRLQSILSAEGVFEPTDREWLGEFAGFAWETQNQGSISFDDYENAYDMSPLYTSKTGTGFALVGRLVMSPAQLSYARQNIYGIQKGIQEIIDMQLFDFRKQIEGVVANGDTSRYQRVGDPNCRSTGNTAYPGVLNGNNGTHLTVISAGIDNDDDVATNGDFMATFNKVEKTMNEAGIRTDVVHCIMDLGTMQKLRNSRHSTSGIYEMEDIKNSFPKWTLDVEDHVLEYAAETTHRMFFIQPRSGEGQKLLKYKISKELHVVQCYGGGMDKNGKYMWLLGWKGGPLVLNEHCVVKTGSLTGL